MVTAVATPFNLIEATVKSAVSSFDARDVGEIRITLGDADKDGALDMRVRVYGKIPILDSEPTLKLSMGPFNVPAKQALEIGTRIVALLPGAAGPIGGMVLGAAAGATGSLQHLLSGK